MLDVTFEQKQQEYEEKARQIQEEARREEEKRHRQQLAESQREFKKFDYQFTREYEEKKHREQLAESQRSFKQFDYQLSRQQQQNQGGGWNPFAAVAGALQEVGKKVTGALQYTAGVLGETVGTAVAQMAELGYYAYSYATKGRIEDPGWSEWVEKQSEELEKQGSINLTGSEELYRQTQAVLETEIVPGYKVKDLVGDVVLTVATAGAGAAIKGAARGASVAARTLLKDIAKEAAEDVAQGMASSVISTYTGVTVPFVPTGKPKFRGKPKGHIDVDVDVHGGKHGAPSIDIGNAGKTDIGVDVGKREQDLFRPPEPQTPRPDVEPTHPRPEVPGPEPSKPPKTEPEFSPGPRRPKEEFEVRSPRPEPEYPGIPPRREPELPGPSPRPKEESGIVKWPRREEPEFPGRPPRTEPEFPGPPRRDVDVGAPRRVGVEPTHPRGKPEWPGRPRGGEDLASVISRRLEEVTRRLEDVEGRIRMGGTMRRIEDISTRVSKRLDELVDRIRRTLGEAFSKRLDELSKRLDELTSRLRRADDLATSGRRVEAPRLHVEDIRARIARSLKELDEKLARQFENVVNRIRSELRRISVDEGLSRFVRRSELDEVDNLLRRMDLEDAAERLKQISRRVDDVRLRRRLNRLAERLRNLIKERRKAMLKHLKRGAATIAISGAASQLIKLVGGEEDEEGTTGAVGGAESSASNVKRVVETFFKTEPETQGAGGGSSHVAVDARGASTESPVDKLIPEFLRPRCPSS